MSEFTLIPDFGAALECKPSVEVAKYGDGYEQRVGTAINAQANKWSLKFTREAAAALAFVKARNGQESFTWTDPLGVSGSYVCREWNLSHLGATHFALLCDFEQVFE